MRAKGASVERFEASTRRRVPDAKAVEKFVDKCPKIVWEKVGTGESTSQGRCHSRNNRLNSMDCMETRDLAGTWGMIRSTGGDCGKVYPHRPA